MVSSLRIQDDRIAPHIVGSDFVESQPMADSYVD